MITSYLYSEPTQVPENALVINTSQDVEEFVATLPINQHHAWVLNFPASEENTVLAGKLAKSIKQERYTGEYFFYVEADVSRAHGLGFFSDVLWELTTPPGIVRISNLFKLPKDYSQCPQLDL